MLMGREDQVHTRVGEPRAGTRGLLAYLVFACGIAVLLSLYFVVKHRAFAFVDIGIDLFNFYYPIQVAQAHQLRHLHDLTWSFQLGLGGYLGLPINPIRLLCAALPESMQLGARLPIYFLRVVLSGAFFYGYLRRIRFDRDLAVIGALAFAYSSYAVVNGQWDSEGLVILQFAAYLFFLESYLRSKNAWFAVGAGVTIGAGSIFYPFTFALLTILYAIARPVFIAGRDPVAAYLATLVKYACWVALGFLLTAFIQFPNFLYFLDSPRVTGGHSVFAELLSRAWTLNGQDTINAEIAGFFGKDLLGVGSGYHGYSNWFEAPGFYVGMLLLLCISQLFGRSAKPREKLLGISGMVLLVVYLLWPFMRYAVYGFGHGGFRLSTLWVSAGLLVLGLAGLRRALQSGTSRIGLVSAAVVILLAVLAIASGARSDTRVEQVAMVLGFTAVYCGLLWPSDGKSPRVSARLLIPIFACELLLFSMPAFMQRNAVRSDGTSSVGSYHDGTLAALALIRQKDGTPDFYRIEKTYRSVYLNDALVQGYSGTKSDYFHGTSITRFVDKMHLPRTHPRTAYIGPMVGRPKVLDLLGVRYLLSRDRKLDADQDMSYIGSAGKINVYRNTDAHGIAHMYYRVTGEDAADKLSKGRRDALLLETVVVDDPAAVRQRLAALDEHAADNTTPSSRASLKKLSDIRLQADISASRAGVLLIAMPFDRGWSASIDGAPVELFRADYGLTAMLLPPGSHRIQFHYAVRGRTVGAWLSLAALIILLSIGVYQAWRARQRTSANRGDQTHGDRESSLRSG
jgi:hypothetical protein